METVSSLTTARPMEAILMPAPDAQSWHGKSATVFHLIRDGRHAIGGEEFVSACLVRLRGERHTVEIVRIISLYQAPNASPEAHARSSTAA